MSERTRMHDIVLQTVHKSEPLQ